MVHLIRLRTESYASGSKAWREKLRRDKLNDRFLELSSVLEPARLPKTDKVALLSEAVRVVTELRNEAQKLKEMNDELREKIKELKAEKKELRDEKNRLKVDKENLEQKVKLTSRAGKCIFNNMENIRTIKFGEMMLYHAVFIFDTGRVLAAKSLGEEAYNNFLDHTFLADRGTTIRQYFEKMGTSIMEEEPPESLKIRYGG